MKIKYWLVLGFACVILLAYMKSSKAKEEMTASQKTVSYHFVTPSMVRDTFLVSQNGVLYVVPGYRSTLCDNPHDLDMKHAVAYKGALLISKQRGLILVPRI